MYSFFTNNKSKKIKSSLKSRIELKSMLSSRWVKPLLVITLQDEGIHPLKKLWKYLKFLSEILATISEIEILDILIDKRNACINFDKTIPYTIQGISNLNSENLEEIMGIIFFIKKLSGDYFLDILSLIEFE